MYQETIIKKPRKTHLCGMCHKPITNKHFKIVSVCNSDFYSWREHIKCHDMRIKMCRECDYASDCQSSLEECFYEKLTINNTGEQR